MADESPAVIFYELQNASGTATLHVTHRAEPGEPFEAFFARVASAIHYVDPAADLKFVFKDAPKYSGKGGGSYASKAPAVEIPGNQFVVVSVEKRERPNKKLKPDNTPGDPWVDVILHGENGVQAKCFYGSGSWVKPDNAILACGLFPNVAQYPVGQSKAIPAGQVWIAHVQMNAYKEYEVIRVEST